MNEIEKSKKKIEWFPLVGMILVLLLLSGLMTTCTFHDKIKYNNIKNIEVKMIVVNEIFKEERVGKRDETNFYFRIESPFIKTPYPDYLIPSVDCPSARKNDTLVCLVKYSNTLKHKWYSGLSGLVENDNDRFIDTLFSIKEVVKVIKP